MTDRVALAEVLHEADHGLCACDYLDQSYLDQADNIVPWLTVHDAALLERVEAAEADVERLRNAEWSIWDQGAVTAIESVREWIDDDEAQWRIDGNPYDLGNPYRGSSGTHDEG